MTASNIPCAGLFFLVILGYVKSQVDGNWGSWHSWSSCSTSCGADGFFVRLRDCDNPKPSQGGNNCTGMDAEFLTCNKPCILTDGDWGPWKSWSTCSVSCGQGFNARLRDCDSPKPANGGEPCNGTDVTTQPCNGTCGATWSSWSDWTECSVTCEIGTRSRDRTCYLLPGTDNTTAHCEGDVTETDLCDTNITCPVHGGWSVWTEWSQCDITCGSGGFEWRLRQCNNPKPEFGGQNCTGYDIETRICPNISATCPVDGGWSIWTEWSQCDLTCGSGGFEWSLRQCNNPKPEFGGQNCTGFDIKTRICPNISATCPVDGGWSDWSPWSACSSSSCDEGVKKRYRQCTNPEPNREGQYCIGDSNEKANCTGDAYPDNCTGTTNMPVLGGWLNWGSWSACSSSCDEGVMRRYRQCSNPVPTPGGQWCMGDTDEIANCTGDADNCTDTTIGIWSSWGLFGPCSVTCGQGFAERVRVCMGQTSDNSTVTCQGPDKDVQSCSGTAPCPVDGGWSDWSLWRPCSVTCDGGTQDRTRKCSNPTPQNGGQMCSGVTIEIQDCSPQICTDIALP